MKTYARSVSALCLGALCLATLCLAQEPPAKKLLPDEFDPYNEIVKDINLRNFTKALADIDAWRRKFPTSEYRDNGAAMEIQSLAETNQPAKVLAAIAPLMDRGLQQVYSGPGGEAWVIRLLFSAAWAASVMPDLTPEQISVGRDAARQLMDYDHPLPGVSPSQWEQARADMKTKADAALFHIAMLPGMKAMAKQPPDCAAAETAYTAALRAYPDRAILSYELGRALNCQVRDRPDEVFAAIFEFERAAQIDPKLGDPNADPAKVRSFADNAYAHVHGSAEGLEQLKQLVTQSPLPPAGFRFPTAAEVTETRRAEFEKSNPQLAMWMHIRSALVDANGAAFFESQMKGTAVPPLRGQLIEAKPACRSKELLAAIPLPDSTKPTAEIRLKLDKPLAGKPSPGSEFQWNGVATAFTPEPFLLTMDVDSKNISDLKLSPCVESPRKK
jgi:hypothetical protein